MTHIPQLILAGSYVEFGIIVHRSSRTLLRTWADIELTTHASLVTFFNAVFLGRGENTETAAVCVIGTQGILQSIASFVGRRTPRERRRLLRCLWVWDRESERQESHPRSVLGL